MMPEPAALPVEPRPAASVIIVRDAARGAPEPIEVYMIRRQRSMKFLGGFYAFPGGKVDPGDAVPVLLAGCHGVDAAQAAACFPAFGVLPPLAFWVTAVRELLEESGVLLACDGGGRVIDPREPGIAARADAARQALVATAADFGALLAAEGWRCDLRSLRYLSHFVTPKTSPIRFSARFFLCRLPAGQEPRLYTEETSEGFWIHPANGYRRFLAREMAMAEPAEYGLAYIAQFRSVDELWSVCNDNREKFTGIVDRIEFQFWKDFDWAAARWPQGPART
ncbi:MAG TPA: NUDIX hydrolase [Casimicrobiaceae bacterium]|jgi:endoribonuclease LACTB2|nr:NUDIX hydrolase [Casimicrobiaceae bacterium]